MLGLRQKPNTFAQNAQNALDAEEINGPFSRPSHYRAGLTLAEMNANECGTIRRLLGTSAARLRLLEMGMTLGTHIRVIRVAAFGGPIDVWVRGYQLSLRREEAMLIWLDDDAEAE
jgi:Fe2+ transport system protein FeoA